MEKAHIDNQGKLLGWYDEEVHSSIPTPNIEVTEEQWQIAIDNNHNRVNSDGSSELFDFRTDAEIIAQLKQSKLVELEALCEAQIVSSFPSSALGSEHWYKSEQIDQLNLIGVVTGGTDDYFKSGIKDMQGVITWDWVLHTSAQLKQVLNDGKNVKTTLLQKLTMQKAQVDLATTLAEVEAVVW